jgi:hypothetical protein
MKLSIFCPSKFIFLISFLSFRALADGSCPLNEVTPKDVSNATRNMLPVLCATRDDLSNSCAYRDYMKIKSNVKPIPDTFAQDLEDLDKTEVLGSGNASKGSNLTPEEKNNYKYFLNHLKGTIPNDYSNANGNRSKLIQQIIKEKKKYETDHYGCRAVPKGPNDGVRSVTEPVMVVNQDSIVRAVAAEAVESFYPAKTSTPYAQIKSAAAQQQLVAKLNQETGLPNAALIAILKDGFASQYDVSSVQAAVGNIETGWRNEKPNPQNQSKTPLPPDQQVDAIGEPSGEDGSGVLIRRTNSQTQSFEQIYAQRPGDFVDLLNGSSNPKVRGMASLMYQNANDQIAGQNQFYSDPAWEIKNLDYCESPKSVSPASPPKLFRYSAQPLSVECNGKLEFLSADNSFVPEGAMKMDPSFENCVKSHRAWIPSSVDIVSSSSLLNNTFTEEDLKKLSDPKAQASLRILKDLNLPIDPASMACRYSFVHGSAIRTANVEANVLPVVFTGGAPMAESKVHLHYKGENGDGTSGPCPYHLVPQTDVSTQEPTTYLGADGRPVTLPKDPRVFTDTVNGKTVNLVEALKPEYIGRTPERKSLDVYKSTSVSLTFVSPNGTMQDTGSMGLASGNCYEIKFKCEK